MNILAAIFLLGIPSLIAFGIIFRDIIMLIELIRDFKSSKSVIFTDDELEIIYNTLQSDYEDLEIYLSEHGINPEETDYHATLSSLEQIMDKIDKNGVFSED